MISSYNKKQKNVDQYEELNSVGQSYLRRDELSLSEILDGKHENSFDELINADSRDDIDSRYISSLFPVTTIDDDKLLDNKKEENIKSDLENELGDSFEGDSYLSSSVGSNDEENDETNVIYVYNDDESAFSSKYVQQNVLKM